MSGRKMIDDGVMCNVEETSLGCLMINVERIRKEWLRQNRGNVKQ